MGDVHSHHDHGTPHEGPIKTPKQLAIAVLLSFVVPIAVIVLLATYVVSDKQPAAGSNAMTAASVAERLRPVGVVEVKDLSDPSSMKTGDQVFAAQCAACHATGAAGAPKAGDVAAWAPRLAEGYDHLLEAALKGKGAMGPQGGGDFSDFEVGRAVVYMANQSGGSLPEPKFAPPAAPTTEAALSPGAAAAVTAATTAAAALANATAAPAAAATTGAVPALYAQSCAVCHAAGLAGAPKTGDKSAWATRIAQGVPALVASAINGKGAMPPRGGSQGSDADIKTAVDYMVNHSR